MLARQVFRFVIVVGMLLLPAIAHGQTPGDFARPDMPGKHTITGLLFTPERSPAGRGVQIRVSRGGNDVTVWTDQDGKFTVSSVVNGTYTVSVDAGEDYEPISQRLEVTLPQSSSPQTFWVNLQLRLKPNIKPKAGVVDASLAGVPAKALQNYETAKAAIAKGETKAAVDALLLSVAEHPDFTTAHTELGIQYQKLDQLDKAEEHLRIALKLKPNAYEPLANLGIVLSRRAQHDEAEAVLLEVLKTRNDSAITYLYLGRSLLAQKKLDAAEVALKNALAMGGNEMAEAHRSLANLYLQRGEDAKALVELETYLQKKPGTSDEAKLRETVQQIKDLLKENE
jgi:Tfp pilus assembly protein PilF